jgi:5-methylcytosine-specific restriction endonuclease McrA
VATAETTLTFVCAQCGREATRPYRGSGVRPTLCGNACKMQAYYSRHGVKQERSRARVADRLRVRVQVQMVGCRPMQGPPEPRRCGCGAYIMRKHYRSCSVCVAAKPPRLASKDAARKARKLRERGAAVEMVDAVRVFTRDGWRCQLCGAKTPQFLRGTYKARAPELDHIIPIAAGGEHSYRNTQCACRSCNAAKRDRPLGQMLLFG